MLDDEVLTLRDDLSYKIRNYSYTCAVKREGNRIYLMKKRRRR